jgi:hypothetical protein
MAPLESLVAEMPQSPRRVCEGSNPGIIPIVVYKRPMSLRIIEGDRAFEIFSGAKELAHPIRGYL